MSGDLGRSKLRCALDWTCGGRDLLFPLLLRRNCAGGKDGSSDISSGCSPEGTLKSASSKSSPRNVNYTSHRSGSLFLLPNSSSPSPTSARPHQNIWMVILKSTELTSVCVFWPLPFHTRKTRLSVSALSVLSFHWSIVVVSMKVFRIPFRLHSINDCFRTITHSRTGAIFSFVTLAT